MNRIRTATIFGTLSLAVYFFVVGIAAMFANSPAALREMMVPLSLLEGLFSESFEGSDLARDLPVVFSLWLAFVCIVDLSVLLSTLKFTDFVRVFTVADSHARRLLIGLHILAEKRP